MSAPRAIEIDHTATIADNFLGLAQLICESEYKFLVKDEGGTRAWRSLAPHAMSEPVRLGKVVFSRVRHEMEFPVDSANFFIDGPEAEQLAISRADDRIIADDDHAQYFMERFMSLYDRHPHSVCIRKYRTYLADKMKEALTWEDRKVIKVSHQNLQ